MKKTTYKFLIHIPIIGIIVKAKATPLFCSPGLADGAYNDVFKLMKDYRKKNPDIQITRQLLDKQLADKNNL